MKKQSFWQFLKISLTIILGLTLGGLITIILIMELWILG